MTIGRTRIGPQAKGYLHTVDATADQLVVVAEVPFKHSATATVWLVAMADTGDYLFEKSTHLVTRDGATASYVGEVSNEVASSGAGAWVTTVDCTGTTLRVRFTGEAAHVCEVTAIVVFDVSAVNVPIIAEWSTTDTTQSWDFVVTNAVNYWVDWGDGALSAGTGTGGAQTVAHNYGAAGSYAIRLTIEDAADLVQFYCTSASLRGNLDRLASCSGLVVLAPHTNLFTGGAVSFASLASLGWCYLQSLSLSGTIPSLTPATSLVVLVLSGNQLTNYTASVISATCTELWADSNLLPESAIDQILADFETGVAGRPAAGTIALGGTGNAAPSAAGLASKAAILAAKPGWTITHN